MSWKNITKHVNMRELAHYVIGGFVLIVSTPLIMQWIPVATGDISAMFFKLNFWLFSAVWIGEYIMIDQALHVLVKKEKISIVR